MKPCQIAPMVISIVFLSFVEGYYHYYNQLNIVEVFGDNTSNTLTTITNENSNTMKGSNVSTGQPYFSPSFSFNADVPILVPLVEGYYNGSKVYFIHTETSDKSMSDMMTNMINFPTLYVPQLLSIIPKENMSKVYVFTNGVPGSGPYGGGPFMFQIDVFDSSPAQKVKYSQYRVPYLVTWNESATSRLLTTEEAIIQAEKNGELTIQKSELVVNAPIIAWTSQDGGSGILPIINRIFESIPGSSGKVLYVNTDEYVSRIKLNTINASESGTKAHEGIN